MTQFAATRIFTDDVDGLIYFYETITGVSADRLHPLFGEISTNMGTLAIASTQTVGPIGAGAAEAAANHSISLDFLVDDVDALYPRLRETVEEFVNEPTDLPRGNRSLLFRDPDGNLINFFTPTTPAARERFGLS
jgi:predicted enzyme related to lactoylglutathione lyase